MLMFYERNKPSLLSIWPRHSSLMSAFPRECRDYLPRSTWRRRRNFWKIFYSGWRVCHRTELSSKISCLETYYSWDFRVMSSTLIYSSSSWKNQQRRTRTSTKFRWPNIMSENRSHKKQMICSKIPRSQIFSVFPPLWLMTK